MHTMFDVCVFVWANTLQTLSFLGCDCNSHSGECHLDEEEYVKSGNVSGGICDNCRDNTEGKYCEKCKDTFYRNPAVETTDPSTCIRRFACCTACVSCNRYL